MHPPPATTCGGDDDEHDNDKDAMISCDEWTMMSNRDGLSKSSANV